MGIAARYVGMLFHISKDSRSTRMLFICYFDSASHLQKNLSKSSTTIFIAFNRAFLEKLELQNSINDLFTGHVRAQQVSHCHDERTYTCLSLTPLWIIAVAKTSFLGFKMYCGKCCVKLEHLKRKRPND